MSNRFVDENDLKQIDLGEDDWVKVPARISYGLVAKMGDLEAENDMEKITKFIVPILKEWNLKDSTGEVVEITEENILRLEISTVKQIIEQVVPMITLEKKRLANSDQQ